MNIIQGLFDQQMGKGKFKSYDNIIKRFQCNKDEYYTRLLPHSSGENAANDTPIFACKFAQQKSYENWVALANEDGKLVLHNVHKKKERYGMVAHNNAIFDLAWMFGNMKLVTASGDHSAKLLDVNGADVREIKSFYGHTRSVKSVAFRKDDSSVFATGGRDGNILVWDTRTDMANYIGRPDRTIYNSHRITSTRFRKRCWVSPFLGSKSVTGLAFQNDNTLISCGAGDGAIKIWDMRKNYINYRSDPLPRCQISYPGSTSKNGYSSLIIDKDCTKMYVNCLDNSIYCYNVNTFNSIPIMRYTGHQNSTFFIKSALSKDGMYLISGSSDENAYIWNVDKPEPLVKLCGHHAEVTCVAWCHIDMFSLVTCSDDMTHRIWRVGPEVLPDNWQFTGRGRAEIIPTISHQSKLKRPGEEVLLPSSPPKRFMRSCDKCVSASTSRYCQNCNTTPGKRRQSPSDGNESKRQHLEFGPRKLFQSLVQSPTEPPTINLPNFAIDGIAPHLNFSPPKRKDKDWLTKLRIERQFRRDLFESNEGPSPAKLPRLESSSARRCSSPQSPLLRYFKIRSEGHSCPNSKSPGPSVSRQSPQSSR